jgi:hypothetical protein
VLHSFSSTGLQVDELKGPRHCPTDDGFGHDSDTLATAPTSQANRVRVAMQSPTGALWQDVNSQTVSIAG